MLVVRDVELVLVEFHPKDGAAPFARTQNQAGPQKDRTGQDQMHQATVYPPRVGEKQGGVCFGRGPFHPRPLRPLFVRHSRLLRNMSRCECGAQWWFVVVSAAFLQACMVFVVWSL